MLDTRMLLWVQAGLFSLSLVATIGCEGETEETTPIQVRLMADLSGPNSHADRSFQAGRIDHIDAINASGGLSGRTIEYEEADTSGDPGNALQEYLLWKQAPSWPEVVTLFSSGTSETQILLDEIKNASLPVFSKSTSGTLTSPVGSTQTIELEDGTIKILENPGTPYNFFTSIDSSSAARAAVDFIAASGGHTITFACCTDTDSCGGAVEAARHYLKGRYDMEVLDDLPIAYNDTPENISAKPRVYLLHHPSAEWLWLGTPRSISAEIIKVLRDKDLKFLVDVSSMNEALDDLSEGAGRGKVFGLVAATPFGDMVASQAMPDLVRTHTQSTRHAEDDFMDLDYVMGYAQVALWSIAVERLQAKNEKISRENLRGELESMRQVNTGGLLKPVGFTPEDHRPSLAADVYKIDKNGLFTHIDLLEVERKTEWLGW
ncbi:MAG: ABC transporter substrate-binding protein [Deltaproteobacteria bacterium]|nr:ABC transporter substrate-binding protein [Deltaproteobacteria bacterium]